VTVSDALAGKTVLVSGAARGIGQAAALELARQGACVVCADLEWTDAEQTVAAIVDNGGEAIAVSGDVSEAATSERWVAAAIDRFGRLDGAFNNAGIAAVHVGVRGAKTADWPEEAFDRMIAVNLKGVWLAMRAQIPVMAEAGRGVIVNTASIAGLVGLPTTAAYAAAKHGVVGLTKTAAIEYAEAGVRVNAICPGYVETDMTREVMQRRGADILATTPMRRLAGPNEIAGMVSWLMSDAAGYVTGAAMPVDGGYTAG
jgi:NAD(P)-dependent dehydrogenase (short-subunit alcohol dehydrogenase family)